MALEDHLLPNEQVQFRTARPIQYGKSRYTAHLTTNRLVFYAKRGLLGRDDVVSFRLNDVTQLQYKEKGLVKQGHLQVHVANSKTEFRGHPVEMKQLYQQALAATQRPVGT